MPFSLGDIHYAEHAFSSESLRTRGNPLKSALLKIRWSVHRADPRLLGAAKHVRKEEWENRIREARPEGGVPQRHLGPICTGDKVIANGLMDQYEDLWTKLIGVEMEAAGAASATLQAANAPGFLMVRGVSDLADAEKDVGKTRSWRAYACDVAASYVSAFLKSGPIPTSLPATQMPQNQQQELAPLVIDFSRISPPNPSISMGEVVFSATNQSEGQIKLTSVVLECTKAVPLNLSEQDVTSGPIDRYFLFASITPETKTVELLQQDFLIKPGDTDGFLLKIDAKEAFAYTLRLQIKWHTIGTSDKQVITTSEFELPFPARSLEALMLLQSREKTQ